MPAVIVDPNSYDKATAFQLALELVDEFLAVNSLPKPKSLVTDKITLSKKPRSTQWTNYGWYEFDTRHMFVNLKKSRPPVKTPGFAWSFTGFKADLTAPGILAHEHGHHVHNVLQGRKNQREFLERIRKAVGDEPSVSGYEPNLHETFAEAMRLFILNPLLLQEGRPKRYDMLVGEFGLVTAHQTSWREVLQHAHSKLIAAAENWVART